MISKIEGTQNGNNNNNGGVKLFVYASDSNDETISNNNDKMENHDKMKVNRNRVRLSLDNIIMQ